MFQFPNRLQHHLPNSKAELRPGDWILNSGSEIYLGIGMSSLCRNPCDSALTTQRRGPFRPPICVFGFAVRWAGGLEREGMDVRVFRSKDEMGAVAAAEGAEQIRGALAERGEARIVMASAASQFEVVEALSREDLDWQGVT